ncbi:hypothetical protein [Paenibacillus sp. MDMC362]|uniref:hypothetical protein n=1 Tax=Paenibacillus sp. MDMC362 TaxID=2977365 RepID=UPI000DC5EBAB|nr:hypothetical protein [Paenibacillus sp. MDMC362]RAR41013.1 hypothetical protein DP091_25825 [Paenibacillus sp. MDMC362]
MKLMGYELFKVWKKRIFTVLTILLLFINGLFYYNTQRKEQDLLIQYRDDYIKLENEYNALPLEEGKALAYKQEELLTLYNRFAQENSDIQDSIWKQLIEDAKRDHPEAYMQYKESPYVNQEELLSRDTYIIKLIRAQYESHDQFVIDMDDMKQRADEMLSVSIFHNKYSFSYRNIVKTIEDFRPLQNLPWKLGLEEGLTTGTRSGSTDLFMVLLLFLLCTIVFLMEREEGLTPLIRSTRNGKFRTISAKMSVLSMLTVLLSIVFYGSILLLSERLYGFGDPGRYIQSMDSFGRTIHPMTVGQYIITYLLMKVAANLVMAWLLAAIFLFLRQTSRIYIVLATLLGLSFICYSLIHPNSYINVLKYINVVAFYDTFNLFGDYRNINVLGYPISKDTLTFYVGGSLLLILPVLSIWLFVSHMDNTTRKMGMQWYTKLKAYLFRLRRNNSLFQHELYKFLITGKSLFILILVCIISYQNIEGKERQFDMDASVYNIYLSQLNGKLTEDKLVFLREEREKFNGLPKQLAYWKERYKSREIDLTAYNQEQNNLETFAKQEKSFLYVEEQRDYLLRLSEEQGVTGGFVNVISSDALFNRQQDNLLNGLMYSLLLIAGLGPLFSIDYKNDMVRVLRSTSKGRWSLFASKYSIACIYAVLTFFILQIPKFYNVLVQYPAFDWYSAVQSIEILGHVEWPISILGYVVVTGLLQTLGVILMVHVILFLAVFVQKQAFMLLTSTAVIVLPLSLQYIGLTTIGNYSFNRLFLLDQAFESISYTVGVSVYFGALIIIGAVAGWGAWHFSNSFSKRGG